MNFRDFYLVEGKMPPGFSLDDTETIDDFLDDELDEALDDAETSDIDIDLLKRQRLSPDTKGQDLATKPEKMLHKRNIVDENGNLIDNDKLKALITNRPKELISQNSKLKKSGSQSNQRFYDFTLPSYQGLYVDEATGEFKIVRTCPSAGECKKYCYAAKGGYIQYPMSSLTASRVINFLMNDYEGFKKQLLSELKKLVSIATPKGKKIVLRWHDSGDFISEKYLLMAYEIAKSIPEVLHYAYTKQVPLVKKLQSQKPDNFIFNFSLGELHDVEIDVEKDKYAKVVPSNLFNDLPVEKIKDNKGNNIAIKFKSKEINELKKRVAKEFKLNPKTVITYDEMIKLPVDKSKEWNVLVWKGHGDDAATREDVRGTLLLFH